MYNQKKKQKTQIDNNRETRESMKCSSLTGRTFPRTQIKSKRKYIILDELRVVCIRKECKA